VAGFKPASKLNVSSGQQQLAASEVIYF